MDKFSKWIEAVPVTNQEATMAVKFFESIVYRYGVPKSIITDNGTSPRSSASRSNTPRWRTPSPTAKLKRPMGSSAQD
jgi:hypothetical protein